MRHKKHPLVRLRSLFLWHRYFGFAAAFFVLVLAVTGLLLNHTAELSLDKRPVRAGWLLGLYGLTPMVEPIAFEAGGHWLSQTGKQMYFDETALPGNHPALKGAVKTVDGTIIALADRMLLLGPTGEVVEQLPALTDVRSLGINAAGETLARTARGQYRLDTTLLEWRESADDAAVWSQPKTLPPSLRDKITASYGGSDITVERVLLDLHSGRLFGGFGVLVMDVAAILLVLLAITGVWHWARRRK